NSLTIGKFFYYVLTNDCNRRQAWRFYRVSRISSYHRGHIGRALSQSQSKKEDLYMRMRFSEMLLITSLVTMFGLVPLASGQASVIDSSSKLMVHAFKSGLFSGLADNHEIEAPISDGTVDEGALRVRFVVDANRMKVLDPK